MITLDIEPVAIGQAFGKVSQFRVESSSMALPFSQDYLTLHIGKPPAPISRGHITWNNRVCG